MSEEFIDINTVKLNNNCPECFSKEGLQLTFQQRFKDTKLYKKLTQDISTKMHCSVCDNAIYPSSWTEDIERVYDYHMKAFKPKKSYLKLKQIAFVLIAIGVLSITALAAFFIYKFK